MNTSPVDHITEEGPAGPDHASPRERAPLGELLVEAGFATTDQIEEALAEGGETGERLGEVVVRRHWATEDDVAILLAQQWGLNYVASGGIWFESDALSRLSREDARRVEALPTRIQDGHVVVAVAEPTEERLADLRELIGDDILVVVVPRTALQTGLQSELLTSDNSEADEQQERPPGTVVHLTYPPTAEDATETALLDARAEDTQSLRAPVAGDSVAALAAQVRGVADAIAALAEYEQRVAELETELDAQRRDALEIEAELDTRRRASAEIRDLLARVVRILDQSA